MKTHLHTQQDQLFKTNWPITHVILSEDKQSSGPFVNKKVELVDIPIILIKETWQVQPQGQQTQKKK